MAYKVFVAGDILTAEQVNDNLMEQAIATFATTAARSASIAAPNHGQFAFITDTNTLTYYNGSSWVSFGGALEPSSPLLLMGG